MQKTLLQATNKRSVKALILDQTTTQANTQTFQLIKLANKYCPRIEVFPGDELSQILDVGQHPIASAIMKIHLYGHQNSVPQEASQVLRIFHDICRSNYNSPSIVLLDPLIYNSVSCAQAQLEVFRKKEWVWLVRAGLPISLPGKICESWDLITIQPNYRQLEIALVLSRGGDRMTFLPEYTEFPPNQDAVQVIHHLYIRNEEQL